ncbi:bacterio-opsin activator domain-containing protein [Haloprofundus salilacus]|uniref:bacterio-opsin activator domain-containing protein n=1 Tax=Haloprofundus salilacus TaxID=2876190 RepID=UPI001CCF0DA1|nr:bacterio-opsin activator domain-containing protein [Haloprofundus salilacus]
MTHQNPPEDGRRIASGAPDTTHRCTIWLQTDGTIAAVTDRFLETTRYTREEFVGRDALSVLTREVDEPDDEANDALAKAIQRLLDANTISVETVETEVPTADDDTASFALDLISRPPDEEFRGSVGVQPDESEQGIHGRDRWVKIRAMDDASIALCLTDPRRPGNPLIYVNRGFEAVTGYTAEEAIGQNCRFLQGDDTDPEAVDQLREAVDEGEPASVELKNYRKDGTPFWNQVEVVPIRDENGEIVHFLGSQRDVTERKQRERKLREQREQLLALDQINRVIQGINSALVSMSTREEVEELVCRRLADSSSYAAAWIGEVNSARGTITPRASDGIDTAALESETEALDVANADDERFASPAMRATRTQEVVVVSNIEDEADSEWSAWALENGYNSAAAVPIGFQEFQYDVLTIYSSRDHAFSGQERGAVAQLREIVGHAINAIERKEALLDNIVVELEFVMRDPSSPLFGATNDGDCTVTYERTIPLADDKAIQFIRVNGMGWEEVRTALTDDPSVDHARVVSEQEDGCLVEIRSPETPITSKLATYGGQVVEAVVEDGEFRVVVEVPHEIDIREIATAVQRAYPDAELVAQRSTTRSVQTLKQFQSALASRLTDKQQAALEAAFVAGYFTWPRESTGEEIAEGLGIAPATFHEHLRNGLAQLLGASLEGADRSN